MGGDDRSIAGAFAGLLLAAAAVAFLGACAKRLLRAESTVEHRDDRGRGLCQPCAGAPPMSQPQQGARPAPGGPRALGADPPSVFRNSSERAVDVEVVGGGVTDGTMKHAEWLEGVRPGDETPMRGPAQRRCAGDILRVYDQYHKNDPLYLLAVFRSAAGSPECGHTRFDFQRTPDEDVDAGAKPYRLVGGGGALAPGVRHVVNQTQETVDVEVVADAWYKPNTWLDGLRPGEAREMSEALHGAVECEGPMLRFYRHDPRPATRGQHGVRLFEWRQGDDPLACKWTRVVFVEAAGRFDVRP